MCKIPVPFVRTVHDMIPKHSLFPPIGMATLAAYLAPSDDAQIVDEHVESLQVDDAPDLVVIQVYITNAFRAYAIADHYRAIGSYVILGGLHVTSMPEEAALHADSVLLGPGEEIFPAFLHDYRNERPKKRYFSTRRTLENIPPVSRELIKREERHRGSLYPLRVNYWFNTMIIKLSM